MSTYAIGDIQGCFKTLEKLLVHIRFDLTEDTLWLAGDLINRGPKSLETLRFIKSLGNRHKVVLGNHDLHFLAVAHGAHPGWKEDTFEDVLHATDRDDLISWLQQQPLIHHDDQLNYTMVHAGLACNWDLPTALALGNEISSVLKSGQALNFFHHMYGSQPDFWTDELKGWNRLRCITNFFTRVRFCYPDGRLELETKGTLAAKPDNLIPWFKVANRKNADLNILFGHWAALSGVTDTPKTFALDTGCIWGNALTAMRLEDQKRFQVAFAEK